MTEPTVIINNEESKIVEFSPFEKDLIQFEKTFGMTVYDISDAEGAKQAKADKSKVSKVISKLDESHKEMKAPLLEKTKILDGARKKIKDRLTVVKDHIGDQIKEYEKKEEQRIAAIEAKINELKSLTVFTDYSGIAFIPDSEQIQNNINRLNKIKVDKKNFDTRLDEANDLKNKAAETLSSLLTETLKREEEQKELEELRQLKADKEAKEQEEEIRQDERNKISNTRIVRPNDNVINSTETIRENAAKELSGYFEFLSIDESREIIKAIDNGKFTHLQFVV